MSFRKIQKAKQRPHRERAQPLEREHLGILEKKKDYKIRSNHFKNKEKQLKALQKKAKERNPDEFYFDMINNQMKDGVHYVKNAHEVTTTDAQEKLLKTQDLRYLNLKIQQEEKRINKIEEEIQRLTALPDPKIHYLFYESKSDKMKKQELLQEEEIVRSFHLFFQKTLNLIFRNSKQSLKRFLNWRMFWFKEKSE